MSSITLTLVCAYFVVSLDTILPIKPNQNLVSGHLEELSDYETLLSIHEAVQRVDIMRRLGFPSDSNTVEEVCYEKLGCFNKNGTFKHLRILPESPSSIQTRFYLYTRSNGDEPQMLDYIDESTVLTSSLNQESPIKIVIHGFFQDSTKSTFTKIRKAILDKENANVILVDWGRGARPPFYNAASVNTELVGRQVAALIKLLIEKRGVSTANIHITGYSLGAHAAGFAGKRLKEISGARIKRITALDPAGPFFEGKGKDVHLSYDDAEYVDVIHTSVGTDILSGEVGMHEAIGHVDFYPNGGNQQPMCYPKKGLVDGLVCNHKASSMYFIDSMTNDCHYQSYPCQGGYEDFLAGKCFGCVSGCGNMGYHSHKSNSAGSLYLVTRRDEPYCGKPVNIAVKASNNQKRTYGEVYITVVGNRGKSDTIILTKKSDTTIESGAELSLLVGVDAAVLPVHKVKITYNRYKGWFTSGTETWKIDYVKITTENKSSYNVCAPETELENGREKKLNIGGNC
ncbi:pancreatic lipase-related protein 2-like [Tachypleus tridentatus]|uniref:pancreatic lipase-related protein 2-like n=1 Tax=Tachypleus tridentatus TaxID=6853 RepID=UPI003FD23BC0